MGDIKSAVQKQCTKDSPHGSWLIIGLNGNNLALKQTGSGIDSLKNALPDNEILWALLTLRLTIETIEQPRYIFMQWKGPATTGMQKVKANQKHQEALNLLSPNHGQLEVIGKTEFSEEHIQKKWHPSAGSHVIN